MTENVIEWLNGQKTATMTIASGGRLRARVLKLAEEYPDEIEIVAVNRDGSVCAHIPTDWIKINPKRKISDAEKERLEQMRLEYRRSLV